MRVRVQPEGRQVQVGVAPTGNADLAALGRALWRKRALIAGLTLIAAALAGIAVNLITPRYRSEARVLIGNRLNPASDQAGERGPAGEQEAVARQIRLILSRDLAREVIGKLGLGERPEFDPTRTGFRLPQALTRLVGLDQEASDSSREERLLRSYFDRLSASQVEKSRVIAIAFESQDAELAAQVANAVAEPHHVVREAARQEQVRMTDARLAEIERLRRSVAEAEARVERRRANTDLTDGNSNTTLVNRQLGNVQAQLAAVRAQKANAEARAKPIRDALKAGTPIEFSDLVDSEPMRRLSAQRRVLRTQLAEPATAQEAQAKELRAQVADLDDQVHEEADRLARSLEGEARFAGAKANALAAVLERLQRPPAQADEQDARLRALEREAKAQRDLLESALASHAGANAHDAGEAANPEMRFIASATVATAPSWPRKLPTVLGAALATLMLSSGFVLRRELLRALPERGAAAPASAAVASRRSRDLVAARAIENARSQAGLRLEAIEGLAHELGTVGEGGRRITVIGAVRSAGTTMTAIALARSLARQARVVLVDLALGAPELSIIAGDPTAPGVAELVRGAASFGEIITRDRHSRVHLIMAGRAAVEAAAIMGAQRLAIAIEALGRSYDYVIVDAGSAADATLDRLAMLAPRAVLVGPELDHPQTAEARMQLLQAGFAEVSVLIGIPRGLETEGAAMTQAAA